MGQGFQIERAREKEGDRGLQQQEIEDNKGK